MIGIVVLNFNSWDETYKCIKSIFNSEHDLEYHLYLVDNASSVHMPDNILNMLEHPQITFLGADRNKGYSAGNNIGLKQALSDNCEEILIANNDVIFKKGSISKLKQYLVLNENVGIVGPKIYLPDGKIQDINCGIKMGMKEKYMYLLKNTPFRFIVKDFVNKFNVKNNDLSKPFNVYAVSGCCYMMSKRCVEQITPFDEGTFLYEEENIIGHQMEKLGYETVYYSNCEVIHAHGQSTKNLKAFSYSCFVESELYYTKKYLKATMWEVCPLYIIRTLKYLLYCTVNKNYRENAVIYFSKTLRMLRENAIT